MQKNYETFSAAEFLEDAFFTEWIKYQTPESEQFWILWMEKQPSNLREMQAAEMQLKAILSAQRIEAGNTEAAQVWNRIENTIGKEQNLVPIKRAGWWVAAAAVIILMLGSFSYFLFFRQPQKDIAKTKTQPPLQQNDIAPGGNKAILTLADGRKVILDTTVNGAITKQGNITVIKLNGQLAYNKEGVNPTEVLYNTITTPRGGQYQLVLADGTKVWLNAASSLRFPTAFVGKERKVELTGEGYFEVEHDASKPFHVNVNGMDIQVLGTHFNINAYSDEPAVKTTLLEGRVTVKKNENLVYLNPGQQAILQPGQDNMQVAYDVDVEEVTAWKNGRFSFNSADIETIMRQAARWYNVDVIYQGKIEETFSGGLPRSENISQLLKIMKATNKVDFEIKGKQIIVKPKE